MNNDQQPTIQDICRKQTESFNTRGAISLLRWTINKLETEIRCRQEQVKKHRAKIKELQDAQTPNLPNIP